MISKYQKFRTPNSSCFLKKKCTPQNQSYYTHQNFNEKLTPIHKLYSTRPIQLALMTVVHFFITETIVRISRLKIVQI